MSNHCSHCGIKFPQKYTGKFDYGHFFETFARVCRESSLDSEERDKLIKELNGYIYSISCGEAALQLAVYRLMHMHSEVGQNMFFDITFDAEQQKCDHYANHYRLTIILASPEYGPAVVFEPCGGIGDVLIFSRGTLALKEADAVARKTWPHGMKDDVHPKGVGHPTIEWLAPEIISISERCRQRSQQVRLIGHSRGSAIVYGLLAMLPKDKRDHVYVLAFCPPGVSKRKVCERIYEDRGRITYTRHKWDLINFFGEALPAGKRIYTEDLAEISVMTQAPHAVPQMAIRSLQSAPMNLTIKHVGIKYNSKVGEWLRVMAGITMGWALPI